MKTFNCINRPPHFPSCRRCCLRKSQVKTSECRTDDGVGSKGRFTNVGVFPTPGRSLNPIAGRRQMSSDTTSDDYPRSNRPDCPRLRYESLRCPLLTISPLSRRSYSLTVSTYERTNRRPLCAVLPD